MFKFLSDVLRLGEDMRLPQEERGLHLGEGCVHLGEGVRLGDLEDRKWGVSGPPRRGFCSPGRTTLPRRRWATPR